MKFSTSVQFTLARLVPFLVLIVVIMAMPFVTDIGRVPTVIIGLALALTTRFLLMALFKNGDPS